jgi:tellurite resistance protein
LVPEPELQALMAALKAGGPLPTPDLETLRSRPDDVLDAVRALAVSDGSFADSEKAMIERIKTMLSLK